MRIFKFRAWHEGHKGKYEPSMLFEHRPGDVFHWLREGQPLHIMQFTGILDMVGKEIYEGDVVKFHYFFFNGSSEAERELIGVVEWGDFGWSIRNIKGSHWVEHTGYESGEGSAHIIELGVMGGIHEESFEVLGNKFENLDLLPSAQKTLL